MPAGELNRRDFLIRVGCASAAALAAGGLGLAFYDSKGPAPSEGQKALTGLGDYTPRGPEQAKMAIVRGVDRAAMFQQGVKALGGMESFIQKGDRVLVKVNAAFATPASLGATTHPEALAAVADLCFRAGAAQVLVTDNPINNPDSCFEISGLAHAARSTGARIIAPRAALFAPLSLPGGKLLQNWPVMAGVFQGVTKVMVVSPVKDHQRAGASMTLKNFYGFLGGRRNVFHQDINGIITELALLLKPTLCVLDGTVSMMTNGPTGGSLSDLKDTGTMVVTTDPVAADAMGVELLGRSLSDVPYIQMAEKAGAGQADYRRLNPVLLDTRA
ncbi:MAG: Tat pathway signal protein [Deltaproteobacteria bacterium RBG_13_58_19]|nr:MAG: Tat pathway signal protein [Deltaproteobacteria bacterium RBG_13_58_19]